MNQPQNPPRVMTDRILIDIPFVNPYFGIRVRIPTMEKAKNIKEKDRYLFHVGQMPNTNTQYVKIDIIQPLIFLTIKDYSGNGFETITMNSFHLMRLRNTLLHTMKRIQTSNLYYYMEGRLRVNTDLANNLKTELNIFKQLVKIEFTVVSKVVETGSIPVEYEGISIGINTTVMNFLTVDEIQFLYETLSEINTTNLSVYASRFINPIQINQ